MRRLFRRRKDDDIIEGEIEEIHEEQEAAESDAASTTQAPYEENVPLERVAPDIPTPDEAALTPYVRRPTRRRTAALPRWRLPRLLVWEAIHPALLLLALGFVAGGVFWTMHNLDQTNAQAEKWWPAVLLGFALLWALYALVTRRPSSFLAASALLGLGISLLLDTQDFITWQETLVASILITVGVGIVARGFLLRQGTAAR